MKNIARLYKEFEIRINGDNGKKKPMVMIIRWLDSIRNILILIVDFNTINVENQNNTFSF